MQGDPKASAAFATLHVLEHPLIQHKLSHMRDKNTPTILFRQLLREISLLMGYEISRSLPLTVKTVETPMATTDVRVIKGKKVCVVPILRAGTGMAEGLLELMPSARVGSIGLYRDGETKYPVEYLVKIPNTEDRLFILADPMLATGHTAVHAVDILKKNGVRNKDIIFLALVSAPEGIKVFFESHPKVLVYTAALDSHLDENAFIVPGLGDAGDRLYGTK